MGTSMRKRPRDALKLLGWGVERESPHSAANTIVDVLVDPTVPLSRETNDDDSTSNNSLNQLADNVANELD